MPDTGYRIPDTGTLRLHALSSIRHPASGIRYLVSAGLSHPLSRPMPDPAPNPELLRSLGQVVRGLSVLFWGLPIALVVCVQTAQADYLRLFGVVPPVVSTAMLVYGLFLLGHFHRDERIWIEALERAQILAVLNLGLSPFLFWWSRMPNQPLYAAMAQVLALSGLGFVILLNTVLRRLTAMLPDQTLRQETLVFTQLNAVLLALNLLVLTVHFTLGQTSWHPDLLVRGQAWLERAGHWGVWFLILLTTATTMAMLWKTKEVIFHSVFGGSR